MEMVSLKCPSCNAALYVEDGLDTFYCKYCGAHIVLNGMDPVIVDAKLRMKEMDHEEWMQHEEHEHLERFQEAEHKQERFRIKREPGENRTFLLTMLGCGIFMLILLGIFYLPKCSHDTALSDLQKTEVEVQQAISAGDYDLALMKANELRCSDNWSKEDARIWDDKREGYIKLIEEKKKESAANNPDYGYAPRSSKSFKDLTGEEAKATFESAGFTNFEMIEVEGNAGWFKKENLVEHINFGGKSEFTTDDYCKKDARITIYYYSS